MLGSMLKLIAWISLIIGPIALLVFFQLQFLPDQDWAVAWWQRIAVVIDLVLLWVLWPFIGRGTKEWLRWRYFGRPTILVLLLLSMVPVCLAFGVATFLGERLHALIPDVAFAWTPHKLLVAGKVDEITQRPHSLWSNRLVLPGIDLREHAKFDTKEKIDSRPTTLRMRGRRLETAILEHAYLPKADFTGANLQGAHMYSAQLQGARGSGRSCRAPCSVGHSCRRSLDRAELQGALLFGAQLQGATLYRAQLKGASLLWRTFKARG